MRHAEPPIRHEPVDVVLASLDIHHFTVDVDVLDTD